MAPACKHKSLQLDVPEQAEWESSFKRPSSTQRLAATTPAGRVNNKNKTTKRSCDELASTFPAPLVLPDDLLDFDRDDEPQSLHSWITEGHRNPVTSRRKTIYVAQIPDISDHSDVSFIREWIVPQTLVAKSSAAGGGGGVAQVAKDEAAHPPKAEDVCDYLRAFYHPLQVKMLPLPVAFVRWDDEKRKRRDDQPPEHIGLQVGNNVTRIRTRPPPDNAFARQLNLSDILDAALEALPANAYSLAMLVDHDTYEDEEDDFCCGRAYGGSRVCMVSSARYHPVLDSMAKVDRTHMWPASHCKAYVEKKCGWEANKATKKRKLEVISKDAPDAGPGTPMRAAVDAALEATPPQSDLDRLWFSRVARTVSHELGHCFCLGHCAYYACVLQGTAGVAEDMRQPPYLCPVCLAKVTRAIMDVHKYEDENQYQIERYNALSEFCGGKWAKVAMFAGYKAWLDKRIEQLQQPR